jgi:hypothetical protein
MPPILRRSRPEHMPIRGWRQVASPEGPTDARAHESLVPPPEPIQVKCSEGGHASPVRTAKKSTQCHAFRAPAARDFCPGPFAGVGDRVGLSLGLDRRREFTLLTHKVACPRGRSTLTAFAFALAIEIGDCARPEGRRICESAAIALNGSSGASSALAGTSPTCDKTDLKSSASVTIASSPTSFARVNRPGLDVKAC